MSLDLPYRRTASGWLTCRTPAVPPTSGSNSSPAAIPLTSPRPPASRCNHWTTSAASRCRRMDRRSLSGAGAAPARPGWVIPAPVGERAAPNAPDRQFRDAVVARRKAHCVREDRRPAGRRGDGRRCGRTKRGGDRRTTGGASCPHWIRWDPAGRFVYFNYGFQNANAEPTEISARLSRSDPSNASCRRRAGPRFRFPMKRACFTLPTPMT